MRDLVDIAILAPSSHNTQPWLFRTDGDRLELRADRTRALPVNDPAGRELAISCGAALFNARVAAARAGRRLELELLPDPDDPDLLARGRLSEPAEPGLDGDLADAARRRRTHRERFAEGPLPGALVEALERAASAEGARLAMLGPGARDAAAALVAEGDRIQFADRAWRRELAAWMRPGRGDGLTVSRLTGPPTRLAVRSLDLGRVVARRDRALAVGAPALAVLCTGADEPSDWLAAGQALERVLLTAVAAGVQASYLNQPIQVGALRPRLAALVPEAGLPQLLLRLGRPRGERDAAPRRPAGAVTLPGSSG